MKLVKKLFLPSTLFLGIGLFTLVYTVYFINNFLFHQKQSRFENKIIQSAKTGKIVFADSTDFDWDKLYIFTPYTTHAQINNRLGYDWLNLRQTIWQQMLFNKTNIQHSDYSHLLVFTKNDRVVFYIDLMMNVVQFNDKKPQMIERRDAIFLADKDQSKSSGYILTLLNTQ